MRSLGIIPARGGSKRLKRKNIIMLCGKPLIFYTIHAAQLSCLSEYVVSSEDDEILSIAMELGAPTIRRPAELSTDSVRNVEVVLHALQYMEKRHCVQYDIIVLLQPTSPIREPRHIDEAVADLARSSLQTLVSVKGPFCKRDPILRRIRNGDLVPFSRNYAEPFYLFNASIYAVKRDYLVKCHSLISEVQVPLLMDDYHSIDIDTNNDLIIADALMRAHRCE